MLKQIGMFLKKHVFAISTIIVLIIVFRIYYGYVSSFYIPNKNVDLEGTAFLNEMGVFGDFFNGVSAPFLGFIGVTLTLITIYAQSQNQLEQAKLQQESTFVSIFNNMVSEYRASQLGMKVEKKKKRNQSVIIEGKETFKVLNDEFKSVYAGLNKLLPTSQGLEKMAAEKLHIDRRLCYEQHLKLLYNILKYIDQKCCEKDKNLYAGILRSFIPVEEEKFIYYEALQDEFEKFKKLLEKYSMMHDIKENDLIKPSHVNLYNPKAFV